MILPHLSLLKYLCGERLWSVFTYFFFSFFQLLYVLPKAFPLQFVYPISPFMASSVLLVSLSYFTLLHSNLCVIAFVLIKCIKTYIFLKYLIVELKCSFPVIPFIDSLYLWTLHPFNLLIFCNSIINKIYFK